MDSVKCVNSVHRRIGGLESENLKALSEKYVHRRIGGLEMCWKNSPRIIAALRRIGGLENDADLHLFDRAVHRRIGGLEKTRTAPMVG